VPLGTALWYSHPAYAGADAAAAVLVLVMALAWGFWLAIRVETVGGALETSGAASDRFYIPSEPLIRKYLVLIVTYTPLPCGCQDLMQ
jgi:hypothetical protein